ncbi:xanthine dehydrogenase family protein molybdopterin-binding subunit, partial [Paraburkholderia sp. SIMBA_027]
AVPLRQAAAQARQFLLAEAASRLNVSADRLDVRDGVVFHRDDGAEKGIAYGELIAGRHIELTLATDAPLKSPDTYRIVGKSTPRVDIPAKAT